MGTAPVYGLLQDFPIDYIEDEHTVAWRRRPQHGPALELPGAEELTDLLTQLAAAAVNRSRYGRNGPGGPTAGPGYYAVP